jgi:hypothetical protein
LRGIYRNTVNLRRNEMVAPSYSAGLSFFPLLLCLAVLQRVAKLDQSIFTPEFDNCKFTLEETEGLGMMDLEE